MKILTNYDFNQNQILNVTMQKLAVAPSLPVQGQIYFNTTLNRAFVYDGDEWVGMDAYDAEMTGDDIVDAINASTSIIDDDNLSANVNTAITNTHTHSNKALLDTYTQTDVNLADAVSKKHVQNTDDTLTKAGTVIVQTTAEGGNIVNFRSGPTNVVKATIDFNGKYTGTIDWTHVNERPTSAVSEIDNAVSNAHTHTNKELLDTYNQTNSDLTTAVNLMHEQNTDVGTSSDTFYIGTNGPKIKNVTGEIQLRNTDDDALADLRVYNLTVEGTQTIIHSEEVNIGDSEIVLNADITSHTFNSDGGVAIKRLASDDSTRADAKITFNNSSGRWQTTGGDVDLPLITHVLANKVSGTVGDGTNNEFVLAHNLNSRDINVAIRETSAPYAQVITDVEMTTLNSITVRFAVAPNANQYTVTIIG